MTEIRIATPQQAQHTLLNLKNGAVKWLFALMYLHNIDSLTLTWPELHDAIQQQYKNLGQEFSTRNQLAPITNRNNINGYNEAFNKALYSYTNVIPDNALWWYQHNLKLDHQKYVFGVFPTSLAYAQQTSITIQRFKYPFNL